MLKKLLNEKLYDLPIHEWVLFAASLLFLLDICWVVWLLFSASWLESHVLFISSVAVIGNLSTVIFLTLVSLWAAEKLVPVSYSKEDLIGITAVVIMTAALIAITPEDLLLVGFPVRLAILFITIMAIFQLGRPRQDINDQSE